MGCGPVLSGKTPDLHSERSPRRRSSSIRSEGKGMVDPAGEIVDVERIGRDRRR